jgi:3-hydroxyacyl-CoA dehydrogenase/3-hydroxy-2-methylbutyryl-CoA dehydrogenase
MASRVGKTYIVTGGCSGLGLATVRMLHAQGANVSVFDRDAEAGAALVEELAQKRVAFFEVDVTNAESIAFAVDETVSTFKSLNGIINCAGLGSATTTVSRDLKPHDSSIWDFVMKVNTYGTFYCCAHAAAAMAKLPAAEDGTRGIIINVASVAGIEGQKGQVAYSASKGAVIGMTLPMARDLGRYGIRVMTIAPGIIDTPLMGMAAEKVRQGLLQTVVAPKRFGKTEEFAHLALALIDNGYMNGEVIRMDAGLRFAHM